MKGNVEMKIYFVDGYIDRRMKKHIADKTITVDAWLGLSVCKRNLDSLRKLDCAVLTNSSLALDNKYAWNEELEVPELYLFTDCEWTRIDKLTDRKLREGHNLMKLYLAGEFTKE